MKTTDLETLSLPELKQLRKDVDAAIGNFVERKRQDARAKLEAQARELGFNLSELVESKPRAKTRSLWPARYRDPADPANTWTGRGRQPEWYKAAIANGISPEKMEIG